MIEMAVEQGAEDVYLHAFLDGRDTPPKSALPSIERFEALFARLGKGRFATLSGRFFAMDRDKRWERIEQSYKAVYHGLSGVTSANATDAVENAYERGETDEFVTPVIIGQPAPVADGDSVFL